MTRNRVLPVIPVSASANQFTPSPFSVGPPKEGPQSFIVTLMIPAGSISASSSINYSQFGLSQLQSAMVRNNSAAVVTVKFGVTAIPFLIASGDTKLFPVYVVGNTIFLQAGISQVQALDCVLEIHFFNAIQQPYTWPKVPVVTKFPLTPNIEAYAATGPLSEAQVLNGSAYGQVVPSLLNWTMEVWLKTTDATANPQSIVYIGLPPIANASYFRLYKTVATYYSIQFVAAGVSIFNLTLTGAAMNDGNWHHIEVDVGNSTCYGFVDGVSRGSSVTSVPLSAILSLFVGIYNDLATMDFNGLISELSLWNYVKHPGATGFSIPAFPYFGDEAGLTNLYHFDGDLFDYGPGVAA